MNREENKNIKEQSEKIINRYLNDSVEDYQKKKAELKKEHQWGLYITIWLIASILLAVFLK